MDNEMRRFLDDNGGIASVSEMAELLELDEGAVRRWARDNEVRRLGSTFAFDREAAAACADELLGESDPERRRAEDDPDDELDEDEDEGLDDDEDEDEDDNDDETAG